MKKSTCARRAAKNIFNNTDIFSCLALALASDCRIDIREYAALFCPKKHLEAVGNWLSGEFRSEEEKREWRITALCLYAAMLESEGD